MVGLSNHFSSVVRRPSVNFPVIAISQKVLKGSSWNFTYRFPLRSSCAYYIFRRIRKQIWPPGGHLGFWHWKFVIAISQKVLKGSIWNFTYKFPSRFTCAYYIFRQIQQQIWPPGGHLGFRHWKFVIPISQKVLKGSFRSFAYRFSIKKKCLNIVAIKSTFTLDNFFIM